MKLGLDIPTCPRHGVPATPHYITITVGGIDTKIVGMYSCAACDALARALNVAVQLDHQDDLEFDQRAAARRRERDTNRANRIRGIAARSLCTALGHDHQSLHGACPTCREATHNLEVPTA